MEVAYVGAVWRTSLGFVTKGGGLECLHYGTITQVLPSGARVAFKFNVLANIRDARQSTIILLKNDREIAKQKLADILDREHALKPGANVTPQQTLEILLCRQVIEIMMALQGETGRAKFMQTKGKIRLSVDTDETAYWELIQK